jgi:hypothetical protein
MMAYANPWGSQPRVHKRKPTASDRIEARCNPLTDRKGYAPPPFPFPLEGPLLPRPEDKAAIGVILRKSRETLRVTAKELAAYLGGNLRTFQKWEQGKAKIDRSTWMLLQMAVRIPEVRRLLTGCANAQVG